MKFIIQPDSLEEILQQTPQNIIDEKLWEATKEQLALGEYALERGYISKKWRQTQQLWAQSTKECIDKRWTVNIITSVQQYTYNIWKIRNNILHGKTLQSAHEEKRKKCKERIAELYKKSRRQLSNTQKKHFKVPLKLRQKAGMESMMLWISMTEMIFQQTNTTQTNLEKCFFCETKGMDR